MVCWDPFDEDHAIHRIYICTLVWDPYDEDHAIHLYFIVFQVDLLSELWQRVLSLKDEVVSIILMVDTA